MRRLRRFWHYLHRRSLRARLAGGHLCASSAPLADPLHCAGSRRYAVFHRRFGHASATRCLQWTARSSSWTRRPSTPPSISCRASGKRRLARARRHAARLVCHQSLSTILSFTFLKTPVAPSAECANQLGLGVMCILIRQLMAYRSQKCLEMH